MKRKKAVCGRLGAFGSLDFLSVFTFFAFGSVELDFFLPKKKTVLYPEMIAYTTSQRKGREEEYLSVVVVVVGFFLGGSLGFSTI